MLIVSWLSSALLGAVSLALTYLYWLAAAATRSVGPIADQPPRHRFAIVLPCHNEETVIGRTVRVLQHLDYPRDRFDIHVVADHCTDRTAEVARQAGARVHKHDDGPRGSKGAALRKAFVSVLQPAADGAATDGYDAVVIFDADTRAAADFLRVMDARLTQGDRVIQGQHRITNPGDGWFPALTWAMFIVDNRLQNLGRANLGWSAKNMGDSICFRAEVLRRLGWDEGLTEDYAFRQRLLLEGIRIVYEPRAIGYGEAPVTWQAARAQRARWLRGTRDASQRYAPTLWRAWLRHRDGALLDGALQARLPSYSTLALVSSTVWSLELLLWLLGPCLDIGRGLRFVRLWSLTTLAAIAYPFFGLALERAPLRAYLVMLSGPIYVVWRTQLALDARLRQHQVAWVRTPRRAEPRDKHA
jgi:cellulose synthase/poly-beta-1,6-N-acetylglucosamine synthase-like glycosyltransferase